MSLYADSFPNLYKKSQAAFLHDIFLNCPVITVSHLGTHRQTNCQNIIFDFREPLKHVIPPKIQFQKSNHKTLFSLPYIGKRKQKTDFDLTFGGLSIFA